MVVAFERNNLGLPYGCLINRLLAKFEIPSYDEDEFASLSQPFTKKTISQSQPHVRGVSTGVGRSSIGIGDATMEEEAEFDTATAGDAVGEGEQPPPVRTICGQLHHFEQSVVSWFDRLEGRMDIFEARLTDLETTADARLTALEASSRRIEESIAQSSTQLSQILSFLQMQSSPQS